jgi:hypothetical protein
VITSGTRSPILRKNITLRRMAIEYSEVGTEVEVGKLDSTASGSRPLWSGSGSTTRTRPGSAPDLQRSYGAPPGLVASYQCNKGSVSACRPSPSLAVVSREGGAGPG